MLHIISIVPIAKESWGVTLTIDADDNMKAITPIIHTEGSVQESVRRAVLLYRGLHSSGPATVRIAVSNEGVRSLLWDALYAEGILNPDENILTEIPQGALDAIALLGGAK